MKVENIENIKQYINRWNNAESLPEQQHKPNFFHDFFVDILGYTAKTGEQNNTLWFETGAQTTGRPDGILGFNVGSKKEDIRGVIEIKGDDTKNLDKASGKDKDSAVSQAFKYVADVGGNCEFVIVTNFREIRLYKALNRNKYHVFYLKDLCKDDNLVKEFLLLLSFDKLFTSKKNQSFVHNLDTADRGNDIEKKFYTHYSTLREEIWHNLLQLNTEKHYGRNFYLYKAQKLIDRIVFIRFCKENGALNGDAVLEAINNKYIKGKYNRIKALFTAMDEGNPEIGIAKFNGGLFATDSDLDCLNISDEIIDKIVILYSHDFGSDLDVNILGHIFEQSISDLENLTGDNEKKRKKDGVFYTPSYITEYIVHEAVGGWLNDRKAEIGLTSLSAEEVETKSRVRGETEKWQQYAQKLKTIKVLDPACGSGAFLVKVFDYLQAQWKEVQKHIKTDYTYKDILTNNIYGVDINPASVGITKLSLWLKTAHYREPLTTLDGNIKIGNSLIDNPDIAGYYSEFDGKIIQETISKDLLNHIEVEKIERDGIKKSLAFKWHDEFNEVFAEKELSARHLVFATHNSRYSQRMIDNGVKQGTLVPWQFNEEQEMVITEIIADIGTENRDLFRVINYNICGDHIHLLIICNENDVAEIAQKIKGKSSKLFNDKYNQRGVQIWAQKYGDTFVKNDYHLDEVIRYISDNRHKHNLPQLNKGFQPLVEKMCGEFYLDYNKGFKPLVSKNSGFDVVVGNPPYVDSETMTKYSPKDREYLTKNYEICKGNWDLYIPFYERAFKLTTNQGKIAFITPNKWLSIKYGEALRKFSLDYIEKLVDASKITVFENVGVFPVIVILNKVKKDDINVLLLQENPILFKEVGIVNKSHIDDNFGVILNSNFVILHRLKSISTKLLDFCDIQNPCSVSEAYLIKEQLIDNKSPNFDEHEYFKFVNTGTVEPYVSMWGLQDTTYIKDDYKYPIISKKWLKEHMSRRFEQASSEKLIFSGMRHFEVLPDNNSIAGKSTTMALNFKLNPQVLCAILNSKLIIFYMKQSYDTSGMDGGIGFTTSNISTIPIPNVATKEQQPFIQKAQQMLDLTKQFNQQSGKFIKLLSADLGVVTITNKLKKWYNLQADEFFAEVYSKGFKPLVAKQTNHDKFNPDSNNKGFKPLVSTNITLSQKSQWLEHFEAEKNVCIDLQNKITTTDNQIDKMVYALYGLTADEINIIENQS